MMKIIKIILIFFLFFTVNSVEAAEIFFDVSNNKIKKGQFFEAYVFIDTEEEVINAIEGKIIFSDYIEIKEIKNGNSIINFWIEDPRFFSSNQILFSGIIPGGYNNKKGFIFSILFLAKKEGKGIIEFKDIKILKHDGIGTEIPVVISNFEFLIISSLDFEDQEILITQKEDRDPPEIFFPQISSSSLIFNGKWFLVFTTQDKGAGIDYYQVLEEKESGKWGINFRKNNWEKATSPYLLKDQRLQSFIYVKAIDKNGNERIAILPPSQSLLWYQKYGIFVIILILVIFVLSIKLLYGKFKNKNEH